MYVSDKKNENEEEPLKNDSGEWLEKNMGFRPFGVEW